MEVDICSDGLNPGTWFHAVANGYWNESNNLIARVGVIHDIPLLTAMYRECFQLGSSSAAR
jgi:hypothetical protein